MADCPKKCPEIPGSSTATPAAKACPDVTFEAGNYTVKYSAGCLSKTKRASAVPDGWYERVRIVDGVIVEAQTDSTAQTIIENPCTAAGGADPGEVTVSNDECNLTAMTSGNALLTTLQYSFDQYLNLTGCGSIGSPLRASIDYASLKSDILQGGVTYDGCGYRIVEGIVQSFVLPITSVVSNNPALQIVRNGCEVALNVAAAGGSVVYTRLWCKPGTGGLLLRGAGQVLRGAGTTANVQLLGATQADLAGIPTVPTSFPNVQQAVAWLDANLPVC